VRLVQSGHPAGRTNVVTAQHIRTNRAHDVFGSFSFDAYAGRIEHATAAQIKPNHASSQLDDAFLANE
jgi:hypothetical protein